MKIQNSNKGLAIYLTLMIMTVVLASVLGVNAILLSQAKIIREQGNAVIALYAADTGIEKALFKKWTPGTHYEETLANNASYVLDVISPGLDCPALELCIKSVGTYQNTNRAIRAAR